MPSVGVLESQWKGCTSKNCPDGYEWFTKDPVGMAMTEHSSWGIDQEFVYQNLMANPQGLSAMQCACKHCDSLFSTIGQWWPGGVNLCPRIVK